MTATQPVDRLMRIEEVSKRTGVPAATLRHWKMAGRGPRAAKFGRRLVWRESEVEAWIDAQFAAADDARGDALTAS